MGHGAETGSQDPGSTPQRQTPHTHTHPATRKYTHSRIRTRTLTHSTPNLRPLWGLQQPPPPREPSLGQRVLQVSLHPVGEAWCDPAPPPRLPMCLGSRGGSRETHRRGSPQAGAFPWGICSAPTPPERPLEHHWLATQQTGNPLRPQTSLFFRSHLNSVQFSCSVMSDSLQPDGLQHARPPCPSLTPGVYLNSCLLSQ